MTQVQDKATTNGKGFQPKQDQSRASASKTTSGRVDGDIAGMRKMADDSLKRIVQDLDAVETDYYGVDTQDLVDEASRRLTDMATGRPVYQAIADNVAYLLSKEEKFEAPAIGKKLFPKRSFKRLNQATSQDLSKLALTGGENESN